MGIILNIVYGNSRVKQNNMFVKFCHLVPWNSVRALWPPTGWEPLLQWLLLNFHPHIKLGSTIHLKVHMSFITPGIARFKTTEKPTLANKLGQIAFFVIWFMVKSKLYSLYPKMNKKEEIKIKKKIQTKRIET